MSVWRGLVRRLRPPRADPSPKLRLTRLRRLNRCYREFLGLFVDAAEKQGGGFILDRQYIVSLVERGFRLGYEIVFHANVLRPRVALEGYAALDRLKIAVRDLLAGKGRPPDGPLTAGTAGSGESPGESLGGRAAEDARPPDSAPTPPIAPGQLREARRRRVRLIENEGVVASPGVASGRVSLVESEADLPGFPDHGVLVAPRLEPTAPLLRTLPRVAAIIVEEATPTDRIAALARAFRVPTLLGVPGVTRRLPPGELVTVDATDAVVYAGVFDELILHHQGQGGSLGGEPEYRLLDGVLGELGSPLVATTLPGTPRQERQTLCGTIHDVYTKTLGQLVADLLLAREGLPVPSPGFAGGIQVVDLFPPAPGAGGRAPDPSACVLAGLVAAGEDGETPPSTGEARGRLYRSEESVTALLRAGERAVLLEAVVAGDGEGNHVMLCAGDARMGSPAKGLDRLHAEAVRLGLVAVRAPRWSGVTAWRERIPAGSAREILRRLGQLARQAILET